MWKVSNEIILYSEIWYRFIAKFSFHNKIFHENQTIDRIKPTLEKYRCFLLKLFFKKVYCFETNY
jgi:hypothetical protein